MFKSAAGQGRAQKVFASIGTPFIIASSAQGFGFGAGEQVDVYWNNPRSLLGTVAADVHGSFIGSAALAFTAPTGAPSGSNQVFGVGQTTGANGKPPSPCVEPAACTIIVCFTMCRSIKVLRGPDTHATSPEISAAALQFVRKVSGYRKPSKGNQEAFEAAVQQIAAATERLLETLNDRRRPAAP